MAAVSVIVPVYNEAAHIRECLESIVSQQTAAQIQVLVVDGMSNDGTRETVLEMAQTHGNIHLLDNHQKTVPYAMNAGIEAATGEVIIRIDGHAAMLPGFVDACLNELEAHPECGCVGGSIDNIDTTETARVISLAMSSKFGVGSAHFRTGDFEGYVDTLAFGAYRKAVFDRIGLFDPVLTRNQDDELNFRLTKAGYKIWLSKNIRSKYYVRGTFKKLYRQYFQYGYWKVYVNRKHSAVTNLRQLVPFVFVAYVFSGLAAALLHPWLLGLWLAGMGLYWLANAASAFRAAGASLAMLRVAWACFIMHWSYGLGYWLGVWHFLLLRRQPSDRQQTVSR